MINVRFKLLLIMQKVIYTRKYNFDRTMYCKDGQVNNASWRETTRTTIKLPNGYKTIQTNVSKTFVQTNFQQSYRSREEENIA